VAYQLTPEVCFTGDCVLTSLLEYPEVFRARVLLMELTFLCDKAKSESHTHAHARAQTHTQDWFCRRSAHPPCRPLFMWTGELAQVPRQDAYPPSRSTFNGVPTKASSSPAPRPPALPPFIFVPQSPGPGFGRCFCQASFAAPWQVLWARSSAVSPAPLPMRLGPSCNNNRPSATFAWFPSVSPLEPFISLSWRPLCSPSRSSVLPFSPQYGCWHCLPKGHAV
jgi:hypothetical protein